MFFFQIGSSIRLFLLHRDWKYFVGIVLLLINSTICFIEENNLGNVVAALVAGLAPKTKVMLWALYTYRLMEETEQEELFETRRHAPRPHTSNFPPQQQLKEGGEGSLPSYLPFRGAAEDSGRAGQRRGTEAVLLLEMRVAATIVGLLEMGRKVVASLGLNSCYTEEWAVGLLLEFGLQVGCCCVEWAEATLGRLELKRQATKSKNKK